MQIFISQLFGQNNDNNQKMGNLGGNNFWMNGYSAYNNNNNQIPAQNFTNPNDNEYKMNCIFKTSNGKSFNILFDVERTAEDLIHTFFKRVDREELFTNGGVYFLYNAAKIDYHSKEKIKNIFKYNTKPCIMVIDVNDLIGA